MRRVLHVLIIQLIGNRNVQFANKRVLNVTTLVFLHRVLDHRILRAWSASASC